MQSLIRRWGCALLLAAVGVFPARGVLAQTVQSLQQDIQVAICRGDWNQAVDHTGALMALPQISPANRATLVAFRQQLKTWRDDPRTVPRFTNCDTALAQFIPADLVPEVAPPLNWESAIATLSSVPYIPSNNQRARQAEGFAVAGLARQLDTNIPALTPTVPIDMRTGSGVSAGAVGQDYRVFTFVGGLGDQVTIDVDVNRVFPGLLYFDDDSQIFLFDSQGRLLVENDDLSRLQSRITNYILPQSGLYYVAVTTYNNDPIFNAEGQVVGWSGNGGSSVEFTLSITGVTPTDQLVLPEASL
ncbi:pre-peptidase C-terminal domain-containing protein [Pseudanabaena sp. FACHB-2040]|uniref:pre-peptidase C-terminal domain-containing protein n=1 Tax=Pseudanabaena sp. FACHB-2040 TaxID=2692859 RepID=UPI001684BE03|nr:pre-peptidase C-terminal domain-containing protein [Pseudanabaena sp. FACHB-2040]MBD2260204.1 pre-peptidase C-terminal domain-containing protein [Pseudanabaena sp. FACHB-2040]